MTCISDTKSCDVTAGAGPSFIFFSNNNIVWTYKIMFLIDLVADLYFCLYIRNLAYTQSSGHSV